MVGVDEAVAMLLEAHRTERPVPALHTVGPLSLTAAYEVQAGVFAGLQRQSSPLADPPVAGYKVSLVAPEHRAAFGAAEPTFGRFSADQFLAGAPTLGLDWLHCPLVEPELVFRVERDLSLAADISEVRASCRVAAGLEIPDSRYEGWFPVPDQTVGDLVADNSFAGLVVHSEEFLPVADRDLAAVSCTLSIDGEDVGTGTGAAVMGDPVNTVVWLSERLARDGVQLREGQRVSAGTFLWPPVARAGVFEARYDGVGSVRATFVASA